MPVKASTLFYNVTYRAAFAPDLEGLCFDFTLCCFALELCAACVEELDLVVEDAACFPVELKCDAVEVVCDGSFPRDAFERVRTLGASLTGAATVIVVPGLMVFEERRFQRRSSSADTPKRSATVMSVSPRCTL